MASIAEILALVNSDPVSARTLRAVLEFVLSRNIETDHLAFDHGNLAGLTDDDHTQYQKESEKDVASGYAGLDTDGLVPAAELGSGTPTTSTLLNGGRAWKTLTEFLDTAATGGDNGEVLARTGGSWTAVDKKGFRAQMSAVQSIADDAAEHDVIFGSELYDYGGLYDTATGIITIDAASAGLWLFGAHVSFAANATGIRGAHLFDSDDGALLIGASYVPAAGATYPTKVQVVGMREMIATDLCKVSVVQNSGGALNILSGDGCAFWGARIARW